MTFDELNAPLGQHKRKRVSKLPAAVPRLLVGVLGLFVLAVAAWAMFVNDPLGGEPVAVVAIPGVEAGRRQAEAGVRRTAHHRVGRENRRAAAGIENHHHHRWLHRQASRNHDPQ